MYLVKKLYMGAEEAIPCRTGADVRGSGGAAEDPQLSVGVCQLFGKKLLEIFWIGILTGWQDGMTR